ncbi:phage tail tape measure protein [Phreatobacter stygius]|uniref:Phage tail tape measure protein n=1 Tax=Phreatobacter stygius TaxID=1940610 RepID=A0A4D7BBQ9_9HYPH|nr:phage tail tape measure protein [Phreatobacter stygius]QCI65522.1 phage tail tape measure protein [Phreatobacter stygius]
MAETPSSPSAPGGMLRRLWDYIGGPVYDTAKHGLEVATELDRTMVDLGRVTRATGDELEADRETLQRTARNTGLATKDIAGIMTAGLRGSRPAADRTRFTEYGARAAVAWGADSAETGRALAHAGRALQASQPQLERVTDTATAGAHAVNAAPLDMMSLVGKVGREGRGMGLSPDQLVPYGAAMHVAGVETDDAATGLNALFGALGNRGNRGEEFAGAFRRAGIDLGQFDRQRARDPNGAINRYLETVRGMTDVAKRRKFLNDTVGESAADAIERLAEENPRRREIEHDLAARGTAGTVDREFAQARGSNSGEIDRSRRLFDDVTGRAGRRALDGIGVGAGAVNRQAEAEYPTTAEAVAAGRARILREEIAGLDRDIAEARRDGGLAGRVPGLEQTRAAKQAELAAAQRAAAGPPGANDGTASAAVPGSRPGDAPGMPGAPVPMPRPAEAEAQYPQTPATLRAEFGIVQAEQATALAEADRLRNGGAAFNAPERAQYQRIWERIGALEALGTALDQRIRAMTPAASPAGAAGANLPGAATRPSTGAAPAPVPPILESPGGPVQPLPMLGGQAPDAGSSTGPFTPLPMSGGTVRPNADNWTLPTRASLDGGEAGGHGNGLSGARGAPVSVAITMGGVTVAQHGLSVAELAQELGTRIAQRLNGSLHEAHA